MKIALISFHSFLEPGGVKTHILALAKEFEKRGIDFKIIVPRRNFRENYGEKVILLGTSFPINLGGGKTDLVFNFSPGSIEGIFLKEKFEILHFHNASFPSFFQILMSPLSFKTLNILTLHSDVSRYQFLKKFPKFWEIFLKFCNWRLDGAIGVSKIALKALKNFKKPKKIIPNGVDLEIFNPQNPKIEKFKDGKINLLFLGRIEKRKGLIYLLKAFELLKKKYDNLRLIVVGEGPERENCEKFVKEKKLKDVLFLGFLENPQSIYTSSDIFCAPSIFGESFGLVILEAMACGLPIVGFKNQAYKELLKGKIGEKFLVKSKDFKALAKKIEFLMENPKIREKLKKENLKEAQKYSWSKIADKILNFYQVCKKSKKSF